MSRKFVFLAITFACHLSALVYLFFSSYTVLFVWRGISGALIISCLPIFVSVLSDVFPSHLRSVASVISSVVVGCGMLVGQTFSGFVSVRYGWRVFFRIVAVSGCFVASLLSCTPLLLLWLAHRLVTKFPDNGEADGVPKDLSSTPLQSSHSLRKTQSTHSLKSSQSTHSLSPSKSAFSLHSSSKSSYSLLPSQSTHISALSQSTDFLAIASDASDASNVASPLCPPSSNTSNSSSSSTISTSSTSVSSAQSAGFSPLEESDIEMAMELEAETLPLHTPILRSILAVPSNWLRPIAFLSSWNSVPARAPWYQSVGRLLDLSPQHSL